MTTAEIDAFLSEQRTCRVATVSGTGQPHVTPLWFAWDGTAIWLYSIVDSQRWTDLTRDARVALVIDDGEHYGELRGVEIVGTAAAIGDVPRSGSPVPMSPFRSDSSPRNTSVQTNSSATVYTRGYGSTQFIYAAGISESCARVRPRRPAAGTQRRAAPPQAAR